MEIVKELFVAILISSLCEHISLVESVLINGIKIDVLGNDSHILVIHDLRQPLPTIKDIPIREQNQLSLINITISSNIQIQIRLRILNAVDQFKEVAHPNDDNQFVLQSDPRSGIFHLRKSMSFIMDNYCMRPMPKQYYIIKDVYKGRPTVSYPEVCTANNLSDMWHNRCPYVGFTHHIRSINDPCIWKKEDKFENNDEELEQLHYDLNSVFCVENSPLLNNLFHENLKGNENFLLNPQCEIAKARCIDCQILRCKSKRTCCATTANCLLNRNCLKYYSMECYGSDHVNTTNREPKCVRDTTFKFTLTPDFDLDNKHFLCHMQRDKQSIHTSAMTTLIIRSLEPFPIMTTKFEKILQHSSLSILPNLRMTVFPSLMEKMDNVIFERRGYEYFMHSLKTSRQFTSSAPKLYNDHSKSYIKVQFETPFQFTSETWSKKTCNVNISGIYSAQSIYDRRSTVPVRLLQRPIKKNHKDGISSFHYKIQPVALGMAKIQLFLSGKFSVLSPFLCNLSDTGPPLNISIQVRIFESNSWILHIRGVIVDLFTVFTVFVADKNYPEKPIFHSDIVATNHTNIPKDAQRILLALLISIKRSRSSITELLIVVKHCDRMISKNSVFLKTNYQSMSKVPLTETENPKDISNLLLTLFLSILGVCFLYFLLLAFQAIKRSSKVSPTKFATNRRELNRKLNYKFFLKAIIYLTCKLFYTVSFTLSLVLSVSLSLNSEIMYSNTNVNSSSTNSVNNLTIDHKLSDVISCENREDNRPNSFLLKVSKMISNNEFIRMNSSQSTPQTLVAYIKQNPVNKTQTFLKKVMTLTYQMIENRLKTTVGNYIKIYDQTRNNKWTAIFNNWNTSVTAVLMETPFKDSYLRTFNLFRIYEATAALEYCAILNHRFVHWKPVGDIRVFTNHTKSHKEPLLTIPKGYYHRNFQRPESYKIKFQISHRSEWITRKEYRRQSTQDSEMTKIRLIFMIIDTVLIVYRFYWTFNDIQQMWRSKKEIIQFNDLSIKGSSNEYTDRAKSSTLQWTKQHHLECIISGHLIIAAVIIFVSIICTNLIVLLTSKEHANWLSRKTGNIIRMRSLRMIKYKLHQFNLANIIPVQRHWDYLKTMKLNELMTYRTLSTRKLLNLELYFNKYYFYELCHFQKLLIPPVQTIDFCTSIMPNEEIDSGPMCASLTNCPRSLFYNLSEYSPSKTIYYFNAYIHFSVHILAIVIFVTAIVGIVKIFRKQFGNAILRCGHSTYIIYVSHDQYLSYFKNSLTMNVPLHLAGVYNSTINSDQQYRCWKINPGRKRITAF